MSENNDDALEKLAMEEILKEAKRNADRAKEMGSLGWQKPNISTNKRFLNNMLVSTLRHPIRRNRKFSNDESSKDKKFERKQLGDYDQNSKFYDKDPNKRYDKTPIKEKREKQHESGSVQDSVQPKNGLMPFEKPPKNFEDLYHADYMEYIENYKKHMEFYSELEKRTQHQLEFRLQDPEARKRPKSRFDSNSNDLGDNEDLKSSDECSAEKNSKEADEKTLVSVSGDALTSETSKSSERKRKHDNKSSNSCKKTKLDSVVSKTKSKRKRRKSDRKEKKNKRKSKTGRRISVSKGKANILPQQLKLQEESNSNQKDEQQTTNGEKGNAVEGATGSCSEKDKDKKKRKRVKRKKSSSKRRHKRHHKTKS